MSTHSGSSSVQEQSTTVVSSSHQVGMALQHSIENGMTIDGKTILGWNTHLYISIPSDIDTQRLNTIIIEVNEKLAIAYNFFSNAEAIYNDYEGTLTALQDSEMSRIVAKYEADGKRRPAKDVLEAMTRDALRQNIGALRYLETRKLFWKRKVDHLVHVKRITEQVGYNLQKEAKILD